MKKIILLVLTAVICLSTIFSLTGCSSKEKDISSLLVDNAYRYIKDGEVTSVDLYTDSDGGELVEISIKKKQKDGLYVKNDYYLVTSDITFDAEKVELTSSESKLYGSEVKSCDGKTVEKGYFSAVTDLDDILAGDLNSSSDYNVILTWKLLQAKSSDKEYNIEKINKQIEKLLNEEE